MVRTIPPKPQIGNNAARHTETVKKLRVAAYVRVSTENEEQQTSFEAGKHCVLLQPKHC